MQFMIIKIENIIQKVCNSQYTDEWNEDYLTISLIRELRESLNQTTIKYNSHEKYIHWFPYKQTGKAETQFRDLAIIVKIEYKESKKSLLGVAFLEAKIIYQNGKYNALKIAQLERINKHAPHSQLLLFDNRSSNSLNLMNNLYYPFPKFFYPLHDTKTTALTAPINTIIPFNSKDRSIHRFSIPFSIQLVTRYFSGLDLEFNKKTIKIALGNLKKIGRPKYLLLISLSYNDNFSKDNFGLDTSNWEEI